MEGMTSDNMIRSDSYLSRSLNVDRLYPTELSMVASLTAVEIGI